MRSFPQPNWLMSTEMCIRDRAYVVLGAVGLPVFAGFNGGIGALAGPTDVYKRQATTCQSTRIAPEAQIRS